MLQISKNQLLPPFPPPVIRRLQQARTPPNHPRPLLQKPLCDLPVFRIRGVPPHQHTAGVHPRVPEPHDINAQLAVVEIVFPRREQVISDFRDGEEIQPGVMRDCLLEARWSETGREFLLVDVAWAHGYEGGESVVVHPVVGV